MPGLSREEPRVGGKVELGSVVWALDDQTCEASVYLNGMDDEACLAERAISCRYEPIHRGGGQAEEVEIACLPLDVAAKDERSTTGEREAVGFLEPGDDLGDLLLYATEHLITGAVTLEPIGPCPPHGWGQHQLAPELAQPIGVDVETHIVQRALPEDLLVDASPIGPVVEVVGDRCAAPANVERQLDAT